MRTKHARVSTGGTDCDGCASCRRRTDALAEALEALIDATEASIGAYWLRQKARVGVERAKAPAGDESVDGVHSGNAGQETEVTP